MKNLSKILIVILLCATIFSLVATLSACDTSWDGLHCELSEDGSYYIVTGVQAFGNIIREYVIGDTYKGLPVKAIGDKAFTTYWSAMEKITLPSTLEYIGDFAFMDCDNLESIVIPEGVTHIGESAFYDCDSLTDVSIANSVTFIGGEAFHDCPNLNYYQTDDALYLGNEQNDKLVVAGTLSSDITQFTIPNQTKFVGSYAFYNCKNLTQITFAEGLIGICGWAFEGCEKLQSVTLPSAVGHVGDFAFANCVGLTSVVMQNGVKTMGSSVFEGCKNLQDVIISDSLTCVGVDTFKGCENLKLNLYYYGWYLGSSNTSYAVLVHTEQDFVDEIVIHPNTKVILDYSMQTCKMKEVVVPKSVVFMGQGAFHYCDYLESLTFEEGSPITEILPSTFSFCKKLQSIKLPSGITKIGDAAFSTCDALTHIAIPEGVKTIGNNAFAYCPNLKSVQLPTALQKLGECLFQQCPKFTTICFNGTKEQWKNLDKENWDKLDYNEYLSGYTVECADGAISK